MPAAARSAAIGASVANWPAASRPPSVVRSSRFSGTMHAACGRWRSAIATVGASQSQIDSGAVRAITAMLPLQGNARAKMQGIHEGFVKLFCLPATGIIVGGVVVAPRASELIHPVAVAVAEKITVDQFSHDFTVYPSLSGSLAEAARRLHGHSVEQLVTT